MQPSEFPEEVLHGTDSVLGVGRTEIEYLKERAGQNRRKRMRLCAHRDVGDSLHEMFIVHQKDTYVRPHLHTNKSESLHVIEGSVDVVIFDDDGNINGVSRLGDYSSGLPFYHRVSDPRYHTLLIRSDTLVFHETTNGPFRKSDTTWAPWAPAQNDTGAQPTYMERLAREVEDFVAAQAG